MIEKTDRGIGGTARYADRLHDWIDWGTGGLGDCTWHMHDELVVGNDNFSDHKRFFREWGIGLMFGVSCWKLLRRCLGLWDLCNENDRLGF